MTPDMKRLCAAVAMTASLSGCGDSPAEIAHKRDALCREWGARPGSPEYIQCRAQLEANAARKQRLDDANNMAAASLATGIAVGSAMGR